ncbi:uncharacterized protein BKA78DRAFT_308638 [Phyllosticta capitalensis]|uniref:uncharacterized protein n=1 Tax=Phyllosticta capitalensis TaxID=121624 RepID=UPI0031317100
MRGNTPDDSRSLCATTPARLGIAVLRRRHRLRPLDHVVRSYGDRTLLLKRFCLGQRCRQVLVLDLPKRLHALPTRCCLNLSRTDLTFAMGSRVPVPSRYPSTPPSPTRSRSGRQRGQLDSRNKSEIDTGFILFAKVSTRKIHASSMMLSV